MSAVKTKQVKVQNSAGTAEATLSFDGVNVVSDTPINADIKPSLNASGSAPVYGCRAWVNFDGTKDSTGAASTANTARFIRASGNVSSVVRISAGFYIVNFNIAMTDANYCAVTSCDEGNSEINSDAAPQTPTSVYIFTRVVGESGGADRNFVNVAVFR